MGSSLILVLGLSISCFAQSVATNSKKPVKAQINAKGVTGATANKTAVPSKSSTAPVVTIESIRRVLTDAKAKNNLLAANVLAAYPGLIDTLTSPATAKECWSCVEEFQLLVNASKQVEDRAYAQALIARFAKITGREALAKHDYQASIAIMQSVKREFKFGFDTRDICNNLFYLKIPERCRIALAFMSCKDKNVEGAEKIYVELMKGYYDQPWYAFPRASKASYASRLDGDEGVALISLASALGKAYEGSGQLSKASEKFNEVVELLGPEVHESMDAQDKNVLRFIKLVFALDIPVGEIGDRFDPIIGSEVSLETALRAYLMFSERFPHQCKAKDIVVVKARAERLTKARLEREANERTASSVKPVANSKSSIREQSNSDDLED